MISLVRNRFFAAWNVHWAISSLFQNTYGLAKTTHPTNAAKTNINFVVSIILP